MFDDTSDSRCLKTMKYKICVIGAGVIGLSSAVRIQDCFRDADITLIADKFSPHTTGDVSSGFWKPHLLNEGQEDLVKKWGDETLEHIVQLSRSRRGRKLGAHLISGYHFSDKPMNPDWRHQVYGFRNVSAEELKFCPGALHGVFYTTAMIDLTAYLPCLLSRFKSNGGKVFQRKIQQLDELFDDFDIIVNCTAIGSVDLFHDRQMNPVRGQVVKIRAPWLKHFLIQNNSGDMHKNIAIFPGAQVVTLLGKGQTGDWNTNVDESEKKRLLEGACKLVPSLRDAEVLIDCVGLRPHRSKIRLEVEERQWMSKLKMVVHNYGHSGSGVTLHWGCAKQTAQLVKDCIRRLSSKSQL